MASSKIIIGVPGILAALDQKGKEIRIAIAIGINRGAEAVRGNTIERINRQGRGGHEYQRGGVTHIASVPGEEPATDLGQLIKNIRVVAGRPGTVVTAQVVSRAPYAMALEFGTKHIAPRPYMEPPDHIKQKVARVLRDEIEYAIAGQ